jgi:hypothetical protein
MGKGIFLFNPHKVYRLAKIEEPVIVGQFEGGHEVEPPPDQSEL